MIRKALSVRVKQENRGNQAGYTKSDYARDAAFKINKHLETIEYSDWQAKDIEQEHCSITETINCIEQCNEMFRELLYIDIICYEDDSE